VAEIRGSRELGGSLGESPKFGCLKSREAKSREVSRLHLRDTWQNHKVGLGNNQPDTRHAFGGVNTPLTSRVLGTREIRERKLEPSTREVASSENERRKVKSRLSGVRERRCQRLNL
jgi:hypothetical protein